MIEHTLAPSRLQRLRAWLWRRVKRFLLLMLLVALGLFIYSLRFSPEDEDWDGQRAALAARTVVPWPHQVDRATLLADVRELASPRYAGRRVGSEGNRLAQDYLVARLRATGVEPLLPDYRQPFTFTRRRIRQFWTGGIESHGVNLLGVIRGSAQPDQYLVLSAHYDHLGERGGQLFPGADDNASGVAALLAAAAHFAAHPPRHSIVFALFDAEETGLAGARAFVEAAVLAPSAIRLNLNLDMLSRSEGDLFVTGTYQNPSLRALTDSLRSQAPIRVLYGHDQPRPFWDPNDWVHASDHAPFHEAGVPFLYLGVPDHPGYHRPSDTFERITPDFFVDAASFALNLLVAADRGD